MLNGLIGLTGHAGVQVLTQVGVTNDTVLEKVVVLDVRVVVGHYPVQVAVAPTQMVAQHQLTRGVGVLAIIGGGDVGHGRFCAG